MKILKYLIPVIILFSGKLFSDANLTVYGGISTPSNQMSNIYNTNKINFKTTNGFVDLLQQGIDAGYHIGVRLRAPLNDRTYFIGGFEWNKFTEAQLFMKDANSDTTLSELKAKQNIVPIFVGLQHYFNKEYVGIYVLGTLSYNLFTSNSYFLGQEIPDLDFAKNKQSARLGFSAGFGIDFDLWLLKPMIEFKYNIPNLIGRDINEQIKPYYTLSVGLVL